MRKFLVLSLFALRAPLLQAEPVTQAEFLASLGDDHVAARALKGGLAQAEALRLSARTLPNPRVEFWREMPDANPQLTNWTVAWTPPLDGRYGLGKQSAELGLAAAEERFVADLAVLRREASRAFADWSTGFERRELLRSQLGLVEALAEQQRERARIGEESGLTARRFALAAGEVRSALRAADADYVLAEAAARTWRPDLPLVRSPAAIGLPEPPMTLDPSESPQLRALAAEMEQADVDVRLAQRFFRFPTIQLGWQTLDGPSVHDDGPIVAAGWTVPLVDRDKAARWEAARRSEVTAARLEWTRARIDGEIRGRLEAYRLLFGAAREAQDAARDTDRIVESVSAAFRAGESGLTDLLESLRSVLAARLREIDTRAGALEAFRALEAVLGRPLSAGGSR